MEKDSSSRVGDGKHQRPEGIRPVPEYLPETHPFTRESEQWSGRTMLPVRPLYPDIGCREERNIRVPGRPLKKYPEARLSVMSYNVLADSNTSRVRNCPENITSWKRRRERILREIFSMRADVLCLQDVDFFNQWWGSQLTNAGYDSLFKQRTNKTARHREGVVIAWRRDIFDLFRTGEMEFNRLGEHEENRALAGRAAYCDNVVLMVLLQPSQYSGYPSGTCVVCTQLHDEQGSAGDAVRMLQTCGLTRTIEAFNSDFHLPIVLCGTMNFVPSNGAYEIMCHGVAASDPVIPGPPGKPLVEPLSTSIARIRWTAPEEDNEALSPPVDTYKVLWVPGGSRFLQGESVDVPAADCLAYDLVETESGNVRSEQKPFRSFVVTGLSSGVAYEFRVAAINALGRGIWSERSDPVRMHILAGNYPEDRVLLSAASIKVLREREIEQARRKAEEKRANPRAYELRKLVKGDGLLDLGEACLHPFHSVSGATRRYSDSQIHPDSANVRTDTGFPIIEPAQSMGEKIASTPGDASTMTRQRTLRKVSVGFDLCEHDVPRASDHDLKSAFSGGPASIYEVGREFNRSTGGGGGGGSEKSTDSERELEQSQEVLFAGLTRERDVLRRLVALNATGVRSRRQKHTLGLRSAYVSYSPGGEPSFTTLSESMSGTIDYIFFSAHCLLPVRVLSLPEMSSLKRRDIQHTELAPISGSRAPPEWQDDLTAEAYTGQWASYLRENRNKLKYIIPNELFPSDHLMLMADLLYIEPRCPSTWR